MELATFRLVAQCLNQLPYGVSLHPPPLHGQVSDETPGLCDDRYFYYFLWLCSPARAMASCGSAAQSGLWPPVALQPSAGYGLLWLCSPARAMASSLR
jgi:hypothetical protein